MKLALLLLASTCIMTAADLKIDHVTIAGAKLAPLQHAFEAVTGLPAEYGGPHANHATEMALTSFPDGSYLEFIAIQPKAERQAVEAHPWGKYMTGNIGPCAFAVRISDAAAEAARLKDAGFDVHPPEKSGRTRPDGVRLDWETIDLGVGPRGSFLPFLIRDITPHERRVYTQGKPTTDRFQGISKVVIGVADLEKAIDYYRRAFKLSGPKVETDSQFQAKLAWFEGTPVILAQPISDASWLGLRVRRNGDILSAIVLSTSGGMVGSAGSPGISNWFGTRIFWTSDAQLGWHLGYELGR